MNYTKMNCAIRLSIRTIQTCSPTVVGDSKQYRLYIGNV